MPLRPVRLRPHPSSSLSLSLLSSVSSTCHVWNRSRTGLGYAYGYEDRALVGVTPVLIPQRRPLLEGSRPFGTTTGLDCAARKGSHCLLWEEDGKFPPSRPHWRGRGFVTCSRTSPNVVALPTLTSTTTTATPLARRHLEQYQQVRGMAGRKDRSSIFSKPRPPTRKQRKRYNRRMRALHHQQVGRHSPPGSRAAVRREFVEEEWQRLLEKGMGRDGLEHHPEAAKLLETYTYGDALLDDLMGNSAPLTSAPTPKPHFLGRAYHKHYQEVSQLMDAYHSEQEPLAIEAGEAAQKTTTTTTTRTTTEERPSASPLPTDDQISLLLRSYRDHVGSTKSRPCGIAAPLQLLLTDLRIPSTVFGERTLTSIMTCAATPEEGRRILQYLKDLGLPSSSYAFSILVDLHAKRGDFRSCVAVMEEMSAEHGLQPTLAAYTSLLAACYKVCSKGAVPQSLKAEAGRVAWQKWKEMRIIGVEADAMAYGALLRVLAARGLAEQAVDTLDEMQQIMNVLPTTLCFTSALRAVSRSHENALRFMGGGSKKGKRREVVTVHHGNMARQILLKAEHAQVEQDDGFVAALIQCAGVAGDLATAKAIYLARRVRRDYEHWRPMGTEEHLRQLRGETPRQWPRDDDELDDGGERRQGIIQRAMHSSFAAAITEDGEEGTPRPITLVPEDSDDEEKEDVSKALVATDDKDEYSLEPEQLKRNKRRRRNYALKAFQEREYGKDTRIYSALLYAYSQAMAHGGMGSMWEGRDNRGYLHEWSLRRLKERPKPKYKDHSIPGISGTEVGLSSMSWDEELPKGSKRLKLPKWKGVRQDHSLGHTMDDAAPLIHDFLHDFGEENKEGDKDELKRLWEKKLSEQGESPALASGLEELDAEEEDEDFTADGFYDDAATSRLSLDAKTGRITRLSAKGDGFEEAHDDDDDVEEDWSGAEDKETAATAIEHETPTEEYYFDADARRWKTRPILAPASMGKQDDWTMQATADKNDSDDDSDEEMEEEFYFDSDARQWKTRMRKKEVVVPTVMKEEESKAREPAAGETNLHWKDFDSFFQELQIDVQESGMEMEVDEGQARELFEMMKRGEEPVAESDLLDIPHDDMDDADFEAAAREILGEMGGLESEKGGLSSFPIAKGQGLQPQQSPHSPFATPPQTMTLELEPGTHPPMAPRPDESWESEELTMTDAELAELAELLDSPIDELALSLPGFPKSRLHKVRSVFLGTMGNPSMLRLVPALRENMPETITMDWLGRKCLQDAGFVVEKASEDGLMDIHLLNGMLQVITKGGNTHNALEFHETEYDNLGSKPTPYSDRLVLEMLLKRDNRRKRWSRALAFKEKVESQGRFLDLLSYSSLLEYCGNHEMAEDALPLLKECIERHGSPPGEKGLQRLRLLCRKGEGKVVKALAKLMGDDPLEWLRDGEGSRKREYSYRGRRQVTLPANRLLQI